MADDSIEAKALALVNEIEREEGEKELTRRIMRGLIMDEALRRAIEQHDAFKQEVSDALEQAQIKDWDAHPILWCFIIPKPKPDPLEDILNNTFGYASPVRADRLRAALEARGFEIREKGQ